MDALSEFGIFSEEDKDIIQADYLYPRCLAPHHEGAGQPRRTLPLVEEIDQRRFFSIIDSKVKKVMSIPKGNSALRRVMETYYHHIYHTVAIEGNTLTLSEIRHILEAALRSAGEEPGGANEVIGMHAAMTYGRHDAAVQRGLRQHRDVLENPPAGAGLRGPRGGRQLPRHAGPGGPPHPAPPAGGGSRCRSSCSGSARRDAMNLHPVGLRPWPTTNSSTSTPLARRRPGLAPALEPHPHAGGLPAPSPSAKTAVSTTMCWRVAKGRREALHPHSPSVRRPPWTPCSSATTEYPVALPGGTQHSGFKETLPVKP